MLLLLAYLGRKDTALMVARMHLEKLGADEWLIRLLNKALEE